MSDCWNCNESLAGKKYTEYEDHTICMPCYEQEFAPLCFGCDNRILEASYTSCKDKFWHEACFTCTDCQTPLSGKPFNIKDDKLFCGDCHDNTYGGRCDACGQVFRSGTKKLAYKDKNYHNECFCCIHCKDPIGKKSFVTKDNGNICSDCHDNNFAKSCKKCNGKIVKSGVTYKGDSYHRDCFTCTSCAKELAGQKFTTQNEAAYCGDCYTKMFAKVCCGCAEPVSGLGGEKYVTYEDRAWHPSCFNCSKCSTSLSGKGFVPMGDDVMCGPCANA